MISDRRAATGFRLNSGTGLPFGRPRWLASTAVAPWSSAYSIVGRVARMRVSSPTRPSFSGTLKSTRMNARSPRRSRSRIESFANAKILRFSKSSPDDHAKQVDAPARVPPLVVVPRQDLHEIAVHDFRVRRVDNRGIRVALEVDGDELLGRDGQDALERAVGRFLQRGIHFFAGGFLVDDRVEIHHRHVRRR